MNEVMILGILVALIKIAELATVEPGIGMYAVGALVVLFAAIMITVDPREVWKRIEWADGRVPPSPDPRDASRGGPGDDGHRPHRRPGGPRLLRDVPPAVAARRRRRAGVLPALRRRARVAPPPLHPVHVGARHRRGDLLHPRERPARAHHERARVLRLRHHHGRGRAPLHHGIVAARAHRAGRERDGPPRQAGRAQLSADHGAAPLARAATASGPGSIAWSSSSAAGRCWTCSSTRSPSPSCSSSR